MIVDDDVAPWWSSRGVCRPSPWLREVEFGPVEMELAKYWRFGWSCVDFGDGGSSFCLRASSGDGGAAIVQRRLNRCFLCAVFGVTVDRRTRDKGVMELAAGFVGDWLIAEVTETRRSTISSEIGALCQKVNNQLGKLVPCGNSWCWNSFWVTVVCKTCK